MKSRAPGILSQKYWLLWENKTILWLNKQVKFYCYKLNGQSIINSFVFIDFLLYFLLSFYAHTKYQHWVTI